MASPGLPSNPYAPAADTYRMPAWGLGDVFGGWALAYAASTICSLAILAAIGYHQGDDLSLGIIALTYPPLWLGFLGAPIWASATKGNGWRIDFGGYVKPIDAAIGLGAGLVTQLLIVPLVSWPVLWLTHKTAEDLTKPAQDLADKAVGGWGALLFFVIVGLMAPIAEELFFRGLMLRSFEKRFWGRRGASVWAVACTAVLFGATHFEPLQFVGLATAGAVFGALAVATGRLGPAWIAHMTFNTTAVIALLWLS